MKTLIAIDVFTLGVLLLIFWLIPSRPDFESYTHGIFGGVVLHWLIADIRHWIHNGK